MKAMQLVTEDGPESMQYTEVAEPTAKADEVLIDVHAAGVSFVDLLMTRGQYQERPELPFIPGIEVAGIVRQAPSDAAVREGDRVAAYLQHGGYAEVAAAPVSTTFRIPEQLGFHEGAALALNFQTAHFALMRRGHLQKGQRVLVHGAAGGIGTASIQVAKAAGASVVAVVDRQENIDVAVSAGADSVVVAAEGWAKEARAHAPEGVALVVDPLGGDYFDESVRLLAPEGRHLVIGFAAGGIPTLKVNRILLRNVDVCGVGWGAFLKVDPSIAAAAADDLARMVEEGFVRPVIGETFALADSSKALVALEDHRGNGKLVLDVMNGNQ
jgi:NADPH:quinone reductase